MDKYDKAVESLYKKGEITEGQKDGLNEFKKVAFIFSKGSKLTNMGDITKNLLQGLAVGALATTLGSEMYSGLKRRAAQKRAFKDMAEKVPAIKGYPEEEIADYFDVVKTFSPKSASNPLVAGALVNKMLQFGGVDHKLVQDLANIEGPQQNIMSELTKSVAKSVATLPKGGDDDYS